MSGILSGYRSFGAPTRLLLLNQLTINLGFYMLMPYLAVHLSGDLALAGWTVGLILGVRNFSQQGMFLIGGTLADRIGYKPLIVAGCALRTAGFALLGVADAVPALLVASAATGFAGALFNPAVRAYLAHDSGSRRVEAFALFNVFYQAGVLLGPVVGLALTAVDFRLTCLVAAAVFAVLTGLQIRALPGAQAGRAEDREPVTAVWRSVLANRPFLLFAAAMIGSSVLSFQVYLALPLEARRIAGAETAGTVLVAAVFVVSGGLAIAGQLKVTAWFTCRLGPTRSLITGLALMGAAFLPPALTAASTPNSPVLPAAALLLSAALLALGTIVVFPFELDMIVTLARDRLVATHYGLYNTIVGVGILLGNLLTGTALDLARAAGLPWLPWVALACLGLLCAASVRALARSGRLTPDQPSPDPLPAQRV
ncbi:MDR family MFS transporter [Actinokineospora iranica]|uniref:Major Facilitator Superfamily protein n=1 Tax=Actinokineospora iranica TaxID=1271860 RepID=A0A1G6JXC2_9PSEU|nr:MFS transporter [Actinokineospora iranica]SDC23363.1 Major Facilitator Superfamily protein [Actinokineospora iranica]